MERVVEYYTRFQGFRGRLTGLPPWARFVVFLAALPGILLICLSILAFGVSLLALLALAVPTYRLLRLVTGVERREQEAGAAVGFESPGRKRVEATVSDVPAE